MVVVVMVVVVMVVVVMVVVVMVVAEIGGVGDEVSRRGRDSQRMKGNEAESGNSL